MFCAEMMTLHLMAGIAFTPAGLKADGGTTIMGAWQVGLGYNNLAATLRWPANVDEVRCDTWQSADDRFGKGSLGKVPSTLLRRRSGLELPEAGSMPRMLSSLCLLLLPIIDDFLPHPLRGSLVPRPL